MPDVRICDVTMRDGMQVLNRRNVVPIEIRLQLFDALQRARIPYLEVGSYVNSRVIPAIASAALSRLPLTLVSSAERYCTG